MVGFLAGAHDGSFLASPLVIRWLANANAGEATVFRIGRDGDRLVAEWAGLATLSVDRSGSDAIFNVVPGADARLVQKLETGTKRALLRHLRGELTLHASAVESRGRSIAFVGDPGVGRSTLAFALSDAADSDFALLSDDCLCVEGFRAVPSEAAGWVSDARGGEKSPLTPARVSSRPSALGAIVTLAYGEALDLRQLHGGDAASTLASAMIRFVLDEPDVHRADMDRLAELAQRVAIFRLTRPRGMEHLNSTIARLEQLSASLPGSRAARS